MTVIYIVINSLFISSSSFRNCFPVLMVSFLTANLSCLINLHFYFHIIVLCLFFFGYRGSKVNFFARLKSSWCIKALLSFSLLYKYFTESGIAWYFFCLATTSWLYCHTTGMYLTKLYYILQALTLHSVVTRRWFQGSLCLLIYRRRSGNTENNI